MALPGRKREQEEEKGLTGGEGGIGRRRRMGDQRVRDGVTEGI